MSESKPTDLEPIEEECKEETEPIDMEQIFEIMCLARGVDPKQVQAMAKFINFDNEDERSYYPTKKTAVAIAQLRIYGEALYKGHDWNEYELIANTLAISFMGLKGMKSEQYKDITSGQPNLDKLHGLPEETKQGLLAGILNRGA